MARGGSGRGQGRKPKIRVEADTIFTPYFKAGQHAETLSRRANAKKQKEHVAKATENYSAYWEANKESVRRSMQEAVARSMSQGMTREAAVQSWINSEDGKQHYARIEEAIAKDGNGPVIQPAGKAQGVREGIIFRVRDVLARAYGVTYSMDSVILWWKKYRRFERDLKNDDETH